MGLATPLAVGLAASAAATGMSCEAVAEIGTVELPPLAELRNFFVFQIPEPAVGDDGSWLLIAAFLGLLPTGIDVSLQASEWGKAKKAGMSLIRTRLEEQGIIARYLPETDLTRISVGCWNDRADVDRLAAALRG